MRLGDDDLPKSLGDAEVRKLRTAMLREPHVARLTAYAAKLRERDSSEVPEFDPLDGGVDARVLFLFEKPGPMTSKIGRGKRPGSGFISRDNDDPTAATILDFMRQARIPRKLTVIWNVIPWWNGNVKISPDELQDGVQCVPELINVLHNLRAVVIVGKKAAAAQPYLETTGLALFNSYHPSGQVRRFFPDRWNAIPSEWAKVRRHIIDGSDAE